MRLVDERMQRNAAGVHARKGESRGDEENKMRMMEMEACDTVMATRGGEFLRHTRTEDTNTQVEGRKRGEGRKEEGLMLGNRHACKMRRKKSGACGGSAAAVQRPLSHSHTSAMAIFHPERPQRLSLGIG